LRAPTATRFLLGCIRQQLFSPLLRSKLEQKLRAIAKREQRQSRSEDANASKKAQLSAVRARLEVASRNLALVEGPDQRDAVAKVFDELKRQERTLATELEQLERGKRAPRDIGAEVELALAGLDRLTELATGAVGLADAGKLFQALGVRLFAAFMPVKLKKRTVNKLSHGLVTFGCTPPPVPLYCGPTGRRELKHGSTALPAAEPRGGVPHAASSRLDGEGNSLGNVNRGDWI
jgi:hypothetical protein